MGFLSFVLLLSGGGSKKEGVKRADKKGDSGA